MVRNFLTYSTLSGTSKVSTFLRSTFHTAVGIKSFSNIEWWHLIDHTFPLNMEIVTKHAGFLITEVKKLFDH